MKKHLKLFSITLISITTFIIVLACGNYDYPDEYYSFFAPEISKENQYSCFYRRYHSVFRCSDVSSTNEEFYSTNINEWKQFFNGAVADEDIEELLYKTSLPSLDSLLQHVKNRKKNLPSKLKNNSLLSYKNPSAINDFLYYLGFAKRCEKYNIPPYYYWEVPKVDTSGSAILLKAGTDQWKRQKNSFIKQRYLFKLVHLNYNTQRFEKGIALFMENKAELTQKSMLYRSLGYVAGSYYKLKNYAQANYLYSIIYDQYEKMRSTALQSFHPIEETDWNNSLALAQNSREKTVLWHMAGIYTNDPLRAMQEIYKIDQKSDLLDLLLVRAINIEENKDLYDTKSFIRNPQPNTTTSNLIKFVADVSEKRMVLKPWLWDIAAGYLHILSGNHVTSGKYLLQAENSCKNDKLALDQIHMCRIVSMIDTIKKLDDSIEENILNDLIWLKEKKEEPLKTESLYQWAFQRLSYLYKSNNDVVKAEICLKNSYGYSYPSDEFFATLNNRTQMIQYMDKKLKTRFDKFILGQYPFTKAHIIQLEAVALIYQNKFKEAITRFESCPGSDQLNGNLYGDPFIIHIKDCHDCDHEAPQKNKYTTNSFAKRMIELEQLVITDKKNAAQHLFDLANGYYNMTYYGNGRAIASTIIDISHSEVGFESALDWKNINFTDQYGAQHFQFYINCSKAEEYYLKALSASNDKEFKAQCYFMAAKCEQNKKFTEGVLPKDGIDFQAGKYFQLLKNEYSNTKYYSEIIKECGYFKTYTKK